jgi:uncharacterized protein
MSNSPTDASRWPCVSPDGESACTLLVAVVPNAKRSELIGLHDGALRLRLAAPPIEGRANDALVEWLADQLGVPRRAVALRQGQSSRRKRLSIAVSAGSVAQWLERCLGA